LLPLLFTGGAVIEESASLALPLSLSISISTTLQVVAGDPYPAVGYEIAFHDPPLTALPTWTQIEGAKVRGVSTTRGRSYEFDRFETGTLHGTLSNRASEFSPENSLSPYAPIKSTRPVRLRLGWDNVTYPVFRGISEGYPQAYPGSGFDAVVEQDVNDMFYALNNARFTPGSTTLATTMSGGVAQNTEELITVASDALPMPQTVPFTISVAGLTPDWPAEEMEVVNISLFHGLPNVYHVVRTAETTYEHPFGAAITTNTASFGEALSGERIRQVLEAVGFDSSWYDLDEGQSLIAPSEDLANVSPLEHINLIAAAEFGRFFVSRSGLFTFRDRHSVIVDHLTPVMTFGFSGGQVPFSLSAPLEHSEEKLYNRVRITIQGGDYDGQIVDVSDPASIEDHFERIFERTFPYALLNDAESAAAFVLARNSGDTLRLSAITVQGVREPATLWPLLLAREIGDRCRFIYQPRGGGDVIDKDVAIDGISHRFEPNYHEIAFQCTEVDANQYWILGVAGYSELGQTTWLGF
jgi:hypothetical protein